MISDKLLGSFRIQQELSPGVFSLSDAVVHEGSVVVGAGPIEITTSAQQWAYAVTFPLRGLPQPLDPAQKHLLIRVETVVERGRIGIGCVAKDLQSYVTREIEGTSEQGSASFDLHLESGVEMCAWLVIRNVAPDGERSRIIVSSIQTFVVDAFRSRDLVEIAQPTIENLASPRQVPVSAVQSPKPHVDFARHFQVLLTHSSREWQVEKCTPEGLRRRYEDPHRLCDLPRFEELRPVQKHRIYGGALSIGDLAIEGDRAQLTLRRCVDSPHKIQHANLVGKRLVLCFEDFLAVIPRIDEPIDDVTLQPGSPWRVDDNWFAGLHTVFPVSQDVCIVSSSGADAVLWVDLNERKVIQRWRLPEAIYGLNYTLTPEMSVVDHYIHNDIQLGHLNCAYPDNQGGCYISTFIQGDIGHVDRHGRYTLLSSGHVGCHGVRLAQNGTVYFADSCGGHLMGVSPEKGAVELQSVNSNWLHDAEQLVADVYWFCLGDQNEVALIDVADGRLLGRFSFASRGATVQFVTVIGAAADATPLLSTAAAP